MDNKAVPSAWWPRLTDQAFLHNPYPELKRLADQGPIHHDPESGIYFVLSHSAFSRITKVSEMGRDPRCWAGGWAAPEYKQQDPVGYRLFSEFQPQMINNDGEDHLRMREVYKPAFRAQSMKALESMIQDETNRLIARFPRNTDFNFIDAFAGPLPLRVLCTLFDIPASMDDTISRWSDALIRIGDVLMSPEQKQDALDALTEFKAYLSERIAERKQQPGDTLIDMAIRAYDDETLDEQETLTNLVSMLVAGHETTVTLIGNGLLLLLQHPGEMQKLRRNRHLMRSAVEEFLRVEPGGNMILRVAKEDLQVEGHLIPAGAPVIGMVGAINRDPARFENPDEFDISRTSNAHLTFGSGPHVCIGAPLSRLEAQIAFSTLLDCFAQIESVGEPVWRLDRLNARGLSDLPIRVQGAAA
ncbi:MAG: cytochrome P450 [Pseudomonadota bacterium]